METEGEKYSTYGVRVIARAAELLRLLAAEPGGLTMVELAARADLPRSTTQRIVAALREEGLVASNSSHRLCVGPAMGYFAVAERRELRAELGPLLRRLAGEIGETVDLAVLEENEVVFVDQYLVHRSQRGVASIGARFPAYATANGKVLLAELPLEELTRRLPDRLRPITRRTLRERDALLAELDEVRATGIAFDREEHTEGVAAVATTLQSASGQVAAVSIVMPAGRFAERKEKIVAALLEMRTQALPGRVDDL
jgi:IclR family transcriptional regulator, acetate operon repressor